MARQDLRVMLRSGGTRRDRRVRHIINHTRRSRSKHRHTPPATQAFAISSLVALCFSITALVFFLLILTSRCQEKDFAMDLPRKLLLGLTSLFASITSIVISFCDGHIFILPDNLKHVAYPLYAALCFPIAYFALAQLSLYFDLVWAIYREVPQRCNKAFLH
ncbi:hypothetical protein TIFTF001_051232 [Ficus carica]|uniref:PGG domain-containing protein n=1 Tax=Ficus carica TaxID=3494 RepID=A0AA88CMV6_FICCA|nr:hypothetical protein TIFTF001_051232 [Ficus carica]